MTIKVKTPDNKILEFDVPDGSRMFVGNDVDGNDVFDGERVTSSAGGKEYKARLLPRIVEENIYDTDFDSTVDFRNLIRVDQIPYRKPILFSALEVKTRKKVIGELQKRDNGVRCFLSSPINAFENMMKSCYSWYIIDINGAHQVIFETIQRITNDDD